MKQTRYAWLAALGVVICLLGDWAQAQTPSDKPDVRLVIDISGSMKRTDPANLRQPAVDLMVRLLPNGGRAGIWSFGEDVRVLVPHREVDAAWLDAARGQAGSIASTGLYTNIGAALDSAAFDADRPDSGYATHIILLTDGMVDIAKDPAVNQKEWHRIVNKVLPRLKEAGFRVHTIGLSDKADADLLKKLALATDGTSAVVDDAEGLMAAFLKALESAAPAEQLPLEGNHFLVDSSVEEFTALVFRAEPQALTQLVGPDQQHYTEKAFPDDVSWHRADTYDLITVRRPLEGEWQLLAKSAAGSRVTVVSDLNLRVKSLPNNLVRGEPLGLAFALQQDGQVLTDATFLQLMDVSVSWGSGEAERLSHRFDTASPPADGVFDHPLPPFDKMGEYTVQLVVDGKSFQRSFTHRVQVRHPFEARLLQTQLEEGEWVHQLEVLAQSEHVLPQSTQVVATVITMDRRRLVRPLAFDAERGVWSTQVPAATPGDYVIETKVTGEDTRGTVFSYELDPLVLSVNPDALFAAEPQPEAEPQAVVPADQPPAPVEQASIGAPVAAESGGQGDEATNWKLYGLLAAGNVILLAGGLWFIRRLVRSGADDDVPAPPAASESAPADVESAEQDISMAMEPMEPEPAMEDFDGQDKDDEPPTAPAAAQEPPEAADDFGLDDLEDELMAQIAADTDDDDQLFAAGQDAEPNVDDEVDDVISSLIDELDPDEQDEDDDLGGSDRKAAGA